MQADHWRGEVGAAIDQALLHQAGLNELRISYVRTTVLALSAVLDFFVFLYPQQTMGVPSMPPTNLITSGVATILAALVTVVLRRGHYRAWMRSALPAADGLLMCVVFNNLWRTLAVSEPRFPGILSNMAAISALLAATGGLRLTRTAAILTTGIGLANFIMVAAYAGLGLARTSFVCITITTIGLLAAWMTDVVRRQLKGEVGRVMMERFLPKTVVEQAYSDPIALLTKPRSLDVTIVVTDLRGFTALSETLTPEGVLDLLNQIQGMLAGIVREHGGTVDKFMGDGMLAVFGAPEPQADHAERAVRAARAMLEALRVWNLPRKDTVRMGVGIHSGPAVVGCLGSGARLEFTVIGDTVNVASRVESLTKEKKTDILVSGETLRRSKASGFTTIGEVSVRGREQPLELHAPS